jgi:hypothetical protein
MEETAARSRDGNAPLCFFQLIASEREVAAWVVAAELLESRLCRH